MKTKSFVSLASLIVLLFSHLAPNAKVCAQELYRNEQYHFSIMFPETWQIQKGRGTHVVVKALSPTKEASASITVVPLGSQGAKNIMEVVSPEDIIRSYTSRGAGAVLLDSGETTFWNEKALRVKYLLSISHLARVSYL